MISPPRDEVRKRLLHTLKRVLSPNYKTHVQRENWTVDEATSLGAGLEPLPPAEMETLWRFCNPDDPEHEAPIDSDHAAMITAFLTRHRQMANLRIAANFAMKDGDLPSHLHKVRIDTAWSDQFRRVTPVVLPGEFVAWALKQGADLPAELQTRADQAGQSQVSAAATVPVAPSNGPGGQERRGTLAADVGAKDWPELEVVVLANGLKYRKADTAARFIHKTWGALGLKGKLKVYRLLIEIARHGGTFPKRTGEGHRRDTVHDLNRSFCEEFGLDGNPFKNDRRLGTQALLGVITWGGQN